MFDEQIDATRKRFPPTLRLTGAAFSPTRWRLAEAAIWSTQSTDRRSPPPLHTPWQQKMQPPLNCMAGLFFFLFFSQLSQDSVRIQHSAE